MRAIITWVALYHNYMKTPNKNTLTCFMLRHPKNMHQSSKSFLTNARKYHMFTQVIHQTARTSRIISQSCTAPSFCRALFVVKQQCKASSLPWHFDASFSLQETARGVGCTDGKRCGNAGSVCYKSFVVDFHKIHGDVFLGTRSKKYLQKVFSKRIFSGKSGEMVAQKNMYIN